MFDRPKHRREACSAVMLHLMRPDPTNERESAMKTRITAPESIQKCRFVVSFLAECVIGVGDFWECSPASFEEARNLLILNNFKPADADDILTDLVDFEDYFPVRNYLQLC